MSAFEKPDYRVQDGCWNCASVFRMSDYDEGYTYFCNAQSDRPRCGSVAMDECFDWLDIDRDDDPGVLQMNAWMKWSKAREVEPYGICGDWRAAPSSSEPGEDAG